jgi:hypothetical protein
MYMKTWIKLGGILAILLGVAPVLAVAQGYGSDRAEERGREYGRDRAAGRGTIQVDNNWRDAIHITVWTNRGEELGGGWRFRSGESAFLAVGDRKIKVRPNYKIKVGDDWGRVNVRDVGRFQNGVWYVNVRDLWRATHRDRGDDRNRSSDRSSDQRNVPDYLR